ncbi:hypothetical protein ACFXTO_000281 [Malus domestica]
MAGSKVGANALVGQGGDDTRAGDEGSRGKVGNRPATGDSWPSGVGVGWLSTMGKRSNSTKEAEAEGLACLYGKVVS